MGLPYTSPHPTLALTLILTPSPDRNPSPDPSPSLTLALSLSLSLTLSRYGWASLQRDGGVRSVEAKVRTYLLPTSHVVVLLTTC